MLLMVNGSRTQRPDRWDWSLLPVRWLHISQSRGQTSEAAEAAVAQQQSRVSIQDNEMQAGLEGL